jgi:hypothetical protein
MESANNEVHEDKNDSLSALLPIKAHDRKADKLPFSPNLVQKTE